MLFGVLSGSCQPFFAVRRDKADRQPGFLYYIGYTALGGAALQPAQLGILSAELCQSALQIGVEGVDAVLWSSIFVTLMANKIGGLQFGIYRNCQISSRVFHTAVAALPLTKANRSDFE